MRVGIHLKVIKHLCTRSSFKKFREFAGIIDRNYCLR